jgi:hypothetical protein
LCKQKFILEIDIEKISKEPHMFTYVLGSILPWIVPSDFNRAIFFTDKAFVTSYSAAESNLFSELEVRLFNSQYIVAKNEKKFS